MLCVRRLRYCRTAHIVGITIVGKLSSTAITARNYSLAYFSHYPYIGTHMTLYTAECNKASRSEQKWAIFETVEKSFGTQALIKFRAAECPT